MTKNRTRRTYVTLERESVCVVLVFFPSCHSHSSVDVRCDCRGCCGTDDWNEHADKFSLRTTFEGVKRQVDEISAAQSRKRALSETNYSSKSATCKEATARLQSAKSCSGDTCWCPQCPRYVVDKALVQGYVVAHCDENCESRTPVRSVHARTDERRKQSGDAGTRRVHAVRVRYGRYCAVSLFCEIVAKFRSVTCTAGNKRWIGLTVRIGVFRYHLLSHCMPTQSGGSAHGPRHEHLEHGTELLSKLKRSGDHVILRGDANSHLGPDERLNCFVGRFTTQTSSSRLSWHFVEWCVQESLLHVDSYQACRRRGTWYHNYVGKCGANKMSLCPLWEETATVGGDCARTRSLELTTEVSGVPFCFWGGTNISSFPAE